VFWITASLLSAGVVNWAGDWVLLYGHFGVRPLGITGSAWATCLVRVYTALLLLIPLRNAQKDPRLRLKMDLLRPNYAKLRRLLGLGWPIGLQSLADLGVSTFLSIQCARLGTTMLAAHQVVLDLNAVVAMIPLGLSYATTTRVGQSAGRNNVGEIKRAANASLAIGLGLAGVAAALFVSFPAVWTRLYTNDTTAVAAAIPIVLMCGLLQIGDALGVLISAALVGIGNTRAPFVSDLLWSWTLGMPLGYIVAFHHGWALRGLWMGRLVGVAGSALTLVLVWRWSVYRGHRGQSRFAKTSGLLTGSGTA
jgi:multidrug resistance protein, MATE family